MRFSTGTPLKNRVSIFGCLITAALLTGCGTTTTVARGSASQVLAEAEEQKAAFLKTSWERQARLDDLAWPLLTSARDLCGEEVKPRTGLSILAIDSIGKDYQPVARGRFGLSETPMVLHVVKNSPAEAAGLRPGDRIESIAGQPVATGKKATKNAGELLAKSIEGAQPVYMTVLRDGASITAIIKPEVVCEYPVVVMQNDSLNAFADGDIVYITTGMYRFAREDRELQLVVAHEIAHNAEGHRDKKMVNWGIGTFFDVVAAAYGVDTQNAFGKAASQAFSQDFEREADYVGMYILARADVDTTEAADFWRRMAAEFPQSIQGSYSATHPASAERWANIAAANEEILTKRQGELPLLPERKE